MGPTSRASLRTQLLICDRSTIVLRVRGAKLGEDQVVLPFDRLVHERFEEEPCRAPTRAYPCVVEVGRA